MLKVIIQTVGIEHMIFGALAEDLLVLITSFDRQGEFNVA